jgi:hypothetical protein
MEMRLRLVLSSIAVLALAVNQPCLAKNGHAQHGARASTTDRPASGKGTGTASPAASAARAPTAVGETVAPPVLPPHRPRQQSNQNISPTVKTGTTGKPTHTQQSGGTATPTMRNAIGQPIIAPKNFVGGELHLSPLQNASTAAAPILRGAPAAAASRASHTAAPTASVATVTNRGSINGASVFRPSTAPTAIGGAARPNYGINGTTVGTKH